MANVIRSLSIFSPSHLHYTHCARTRPFLCTLLCSFSSHPNPLLQDFLINKLDFSQTHALAVASASPYSNLNSLEKPLAVIHYFQDLGFSNKQIHSTVRGCSHILLSDVDKTLKPKIEYFRQLGLPSSQLGNFFSKSSQILKVSLEKNLVPTIEVLRNILLNDENNNDLFKVLSRAPRLINYNNNSRLLPNIRLLESRGIVGCRLAMLLKKQPRFFYTKEAAIKDRISKLSDLRFNTNSRMFVYALGVIGCYREETFEKKVRTFEKFGFAKDDYMEMLSKYPFLLDISIKKSVIALDFHLKTVKLRKEVIISDPAVLTFSMEKRVKPRYKVLQIIKSKQLLKKEPSFFKVLHLREEVFVADFISKFIDHKEELLKAYKW